MTDPKRKRQLEVKRAIKESGISRVQLSRDSGISKASIWAWVKDKRFPSDESKRQLAAGLRRRAARLLELADKLEGRS